MITKPKNYIFALFDRFLHIGVIALILVNPLIASAKTTSLSSIALNDISTKKDISHTTVFISSTIEDEFEKTEEEQDSAEDLEKAQRLDKYFEKRNMPLAGHGLDFVRAANKYNLDWRLLAAIGVRESSGGKRMMNNNPFGWGSAKIKFTDFSEAIDVVSSHLGGFQPNTARYYKNADTKKKLWYYNGTVIRSYPKEVLNIMEMV